MGRLSREAIPVLAQDRRDASGHDQIPAPVHPWTIDAGPALAGIGDLLDNLVAFLGGVNPKRLELLRYGVSFLGLPTGETRL